MWSAESVHTHDIVKLCSLSRCLLLLKGDINIALDWRKRLVESSALHLQEELSFNRILLSRHPKHSTTWHHRRWCLSQQRLTSLQIQEDLSLCNFITDTVPKNYHTWVHRLWLLQYMNMEEVSLNIFLLVLCNLKLNEEYTYLNACCSWKESFNFQRSGYCHILPTIRPVTIDCK